MTNELPPLKRCSKCGESKPIDSFTRNKHKADGRDNKCRACRAAYYVANSAWITEKNRIWKTRNSEKVRAIKQAHYASNAEAIRAQKRAYYAANSEKIREYQRAYRLANVSKIRADQRAYRVANAERLRKNSYIYYADNAEKISASVYAYRLAHPDIHRASRHRRRERIKSNGGKFTSKELTAMRSAQAGICAYCQRQHDPDALTIDHIIPIDQGGRHEAANICLACKKCNCSKRNRTPEQWTDRWYLRDDSSYQPKLKKRGDANASL
jgi:5-methylcytosine-specific restriction endonuclease McrA